MRRRVNGSKTRLLEAELACISDQKNSRRTSPWTALEDAALIATVHEHGEVWARMAIEIPNRNNDQCSQRWTKSLRPGLVRGKWSPEEDAKLLEALAAQHGSINVDWPQVALNIQGRIPKQCKERFWLKLDPELKYDEWSADEDALLLASFDKYNGRWAHMAIALPRRRASALKVRFRALQRQANHARPWTMEDDVALITHVLAPGTVKPESVLLAKRSTRAKTERFTALCGKQPIVMRAYKCKGWLLEHEVRRLLAIGVPAATAHHALSVSAISSWALPYHSDSSVHLGFTSLSSSCLCSASQSATCMADALSDGFGTSLASSLVKGKTLRRFTDLALCSAGASESTLDTKSAKRCHWIV